MDFTMFITINQINYQMFFRPKRQAGIYQRLKFWLDIKQQKKNLVLQLTGQKENNIDENGQWDLGTKAKDNVFFPLSDT